MCDLTHNVPKLAKAKQEQAIVKGDKFTDLRMLELPATVLVSHIGSCVMQTTSLDTSLNQPAKGDRLARWVWERWLTWLIVFSGVWVLLPWFAPVLLHYGWNTAASFIYTLYSFQCHQLPQRSYFLYGPQAMVPVADLLAATKTTDPLGLRFFVGNSALGWKVAWSDRMVSLYTPLFLGAILYALSGRRWRPVRWSWWLLLPYLPLLIDGLWHMLDDALGLNMRATNAWLVALSGNAFAPSFYVGDAIGSFNWWARLLSGLLAGFAFTWQVYPYLDRGFRAMAQPHGTAP